MKINSLSIQEKTITIIAPEKYFFKKIKDALSLIKRVDAIEYKRLFARLRIIFVTNKYGDTNEFFMPEKIWFCNKSVITKNDINWLASLIIHEAFHATQFKNGKYILPFGDEIERPALDAQKKFLKKVKDIKGAEQVEGVYGKKYWHDISKDEQSYAYFRKLLDLFNTNKLNIKKVTV